LCGFSSGAALAWQGRQIAFAARDTWEWAVSSGACAAALVTALLLARVVAARLAGAASAATLSSDPGDAASASSLPGAAPAWLRLAWLFALAFYGLLMVFDGRYRDFPLGLFALPCIGYALLDGLVARGATAWPLLEERFLAAWVPVLAAVVVFHEAGLTFEAWLWLGLNVALAWPVLRSWWATRLHPQQA
jgi:glucan 1,3-beta-glucosidase